MKQIISQISFIVHQKKIFYPSNNLLCAISGGQDSFLLFIIFLHLKSTLILKLELVYCNHFWKQNNFYSLVELIKISYLTNIPINVAVTENTLNSEKKSRIWRRKNFSRIAIFSKVENLLTGHTASDQIETAIWHLLRGTSPKGLISLKQKTDLHYPALKNQCFVSESKKIALSGSSKYKKFCKTLVWNRAIHNFSLKKKVLKNDCFRNDRVMNYYYSPPTKLVSYFFSNKKLNKINIIRPLIDFHREEIRQLIKENRFPIIIDNTNQSAEITRNKIRLLLMPLFRFYFQTNCDFQLKKYLTITTEEQKFLNQLLFKILESYCNQPEFLQSIKTLPRTLQSKCLEYLLNSYSRKQIQFAQISSQIENL